MTTRPALRTLTGSPVRHFDVALGSRPDGRPGVTINPAGYRRTAIPLDDSEVVRALITDLHDALEHLA